MQGYQLCGPNIDIGNTAGLYALILILDIPRGSILAKLPEATVLYAVLVTPHVWCFSFWRLIWGHGVQPGLTAGKNWPCDDPDSLSYGPRFDSVAEGGEPPPEAIQKSKKILILTSNLLSAFFFSYYFRLKEGFLCLTVALPALPTLLLGLRREMQLFLVKIFEWNVKKGQERRPKK